MYKVRETSKVFRIYVTIFHICMTENVQIVISVHKKKHWHTCCDIA